MPEVPKQAPETKPQDLDIFQSQLEALGGEVELSKMRESLMKDLDEAGIRDEETREAAWNATKQELIRNNIEQGEEIANIEDFVNNVENMPVLEELKNSQSPVEKLAEEGLFESIWAYFFGEEQEKKEAGKKILTMIAGIFGMEKFFGDKEKKETTTEIAEAEAEAKPESAEEAPEASFSTAQGFIDQYEIDLSQDSQKKAVAKLRQKLNDTEIRNLSLDALKDRNVKAIYDAAREKLGEPINPSIYDIRLENIPNPDVVVKKIQNMENPSPDRIRQFLDSINIEEPEAIETLNVS